MVDAERYIELSVESARVERRTIYGIPLEELLFGFSFGLYWTGVYEHFTWSKSLAREGLEEWSL